MVKLSNQATIIVRNLPIDKNVTEDFLRLLFAEVGNVVAEPCGVILRQKEDSNGRPIAFAFVTFETHEEAECAINELNYTKLDDVPIHLSFLKKRET